MAAQQAMISRHTAHAMFENRPAIGALHVVQESRILQDRTGPSTHGKQNSVRVPAPWIRTAPFKAWCLLCLRSAVGISIGRVDLDLGQSSDHLQRYA